MNPPRRGRFSRLRDGEHDAPVKVRAPLIVSAAFAKRIGKGEITQHRLHAPRDPDAECRFKVGEVYSVAHMQIHRHLGYRRDKPSVPRRKAAPICHVRVERVFRQRLGDASHQDARSSGFADPRAMLEHWASAHRLKRPGRKEVWVVVLKLETWASAEMMASDSSHAYTQSADHALASDKSEVVRPHLLREHWSEDAQARHKAARGVDDDRKRSRQLRDEIRRTAEEAARKGVDISPELEAMKRELAKIKQRLEAA